MLRLAITALSGKVRRQAKKLGVTYEFLFMSASGDQLREIADLIDDGTLRPVVGNTFSFDETPDALESIAKRGVNGKTVITS